ncbi:hypothetical protein NC651_027505 [Populus alba x Populus x berolinensis]|nr:hypothetical protein NC651_027505 [Populus alba x Populus x berolinensis]
MDCMLVFVEQVIMHFFLTVSFYCNRFCYMGPFNGSCEIPEQKVDRGVITVSAKQTRQDIKDVDDDVMISSDGISDEDSNQTERDGKRDLKRLRKGLPRACKKGP